MTKEAMIKVLRYKAEHIKTKIKPKFFAEVANVLKQEPCEDAISRAEAVRVASGYCHPSNIANELAKLPPVQPKLTECEDTISRQAALDIYDDYNVAVENGELEAYRKYRKRLLKLPPVQPKYNTSEWCHDCSEYNQDKHCCPRFNRVIRNAVEEVKKPKTGHWISYWDEETRCYVYKCPECGNKQPFDTKRCWECGTRLVEPQESEETND